MERGSPVQAIGGRYVVESTLGRNSRNAVYRVRDEATGRQLALKYLLAADADAQLRFRREFHTMASLAHPRIVPVFDYGVDRGAAYYTLELLDGKDLFDLGQVPWQRACALLRDVASALAFLHARRLLHRDLASRNVRCTADGRAKLIDFGVLATIGISGDVAGTPPFMAPESLRPRALDQRYDLFGLGALGYWLITGRHAYPSGGLEQLEELWRERPPPPSQLVGEIPPALDELIQALLALDPVARPTDAADVIDRLSVIGGLERPTEVETARGWIASAALVGREREMAELGRAVERAREGSGCAVSIEAPTGTGKSRLLRELALQSQLAGTCVIRASGDAAERGPYGVLDALARELFAVAPSEAETAARPRGGMLARALESVREHLGVAPAPLEGDPAEDRMRVQHELAAWFLEVATARPITVLVDDVQRCDEGSAAVLASLGSAAHGSRVLLAVAVRTDEPVHAPAAIASLVHAGRRLRLRGLDEAELGALCASWFGRVPHIARLARWLDGVAGGNPLHATELARHLVDRGTIRYLGGMWSIPEELGKHEMPAGLAAAMDARVGALPPHARSLGEALSVHGGDLSLRVIMALADTEDEAIVFAALDQLAFEEVLIHGGGLWRFRHDGLREALQRGLDPARRRALHLRVGEALLSDARDGEAGWHLLRGGDTGRGEALLEAAGRALYASQSFLDCIAPLEAALEIRAKRRASRRTELQLHHMLLQAGFIADRDTVMRHAGPCIEGFRYWAGIDIAARINNVVGKHLGVMIGLCCAFVRWLVSACRGPSPYEAFRTFFLSVGYAASVSLVMMDVPELARLERLVEPIAIFKNRIPFAAYLITRSTLEYPQGNSGAIHRSAHRAIEIVEHDRLTPIAPIDRRCAIGGARYLLLLVAVSRLDPTVTTELAELAKVNLKFFDIAADQALLAYHRLRGEEELALAIERRVELACVQLGSIWQMRAMVAMIASLAYAFARDISGLRRTMADLARLCAEGFMLEPYLRLARGEYLRELGELRPAIDELEAVVSRNDIPLLRIAALPALAEALLAAGDHADARRVAADALALGADPDHGNLLGEMRSIRVLALAEAALGDHAAAAERLDRAIERFAAYDSPLHHGALHEARARIASAIADVAAYRHHLAQTRACFARTRNAVLVARAQRLAEAAPIATVDRAPDFDPAVMATIAAEAVTSPGSSIRATLASCRDSSDRAARALQLVIDETGASAGYMFLYQNEQLVLAAPPLEVQPPADIARALARSLAAPGEAMTVDIRPPAGGMPPWRPILLPVRLGDATRYVGAVAVVEGPRPILTPNPKLLEEIGRALLEAGDTVIERTPGGDRQPDRV